MPQRVYTVRPYEYINATYAKLWINIIWVYRFIVPEAYSYMLQKNVTTLRFTILYPEV